MSDRSPESPQALVPLWHVLVMPMRFPGRPVLPSDGVTSVVEARSESEALDLAGRSRTLQRRCIAKWPGDWAGLQVAITVLKCDDPATCPDMAPIVFGVRNAPDQARRECRETR